MKVKLIGGHRDGYSYGVADGDPYLYIARHIDAFDPMSITVGGRPVYPAREASIEYEVYHRVNLCGTTFYIHEKTTVEEAVEKLVRSYGR